METGRATPEVDAFGVDAAVGAEEVEVTWMLSGSTLKPGGGGREVENRDTPVTMPAGTDAIGASPKARTEVEGVGVACKVEILGRGAMAAGGNMGITGGATAGCTTGVAGAWVAEELPNKSRNSVRLSFGSGGCGGTILMQVLSTFSRACCMTDAKPWFIN